MAHALDGRHDAANCSVEFDRETEDGATHWTVWMDDGRAGTLHLHKGGEGFEWVGAERGDGMLNADGTASDDLQAVLDCFESLF